MLPVDTLEKPGTCGDSRALPGVFHLLPWPELAIPDMRRESHPFGTGSELD
jgi:hypothetical protein